MVMRKGWRLAGPGKLVPFEAPLGAPPPGWATVEVIGCGVCHTDVSYLYEGVPTVAPNVVLGHEIVGRVGERTVIVPAVCPCGECPACRRERRTACRAQFMPGNHGDGGFATHVQVPARWLCDVPAIPKGLEAWQLAVIADAITTPYQAIRRARLEPGETAVVVGAGGVGGFLVEIAAAMGAHVVAVDLDGGRLARAQEHGAVVCLEGGGEPRAIKKEMARALAALGLDGDGAHIFECSGSVRGQELAFALLGRGGTLSVVGFTAESPAIRLSNLMALDAEAYGNWGCDPALYPDVLELVRQGKVDVASAVERHPLSDAPRVLAAAHSRELKRRAVLIPDM